MPFQKVGPNRYQGPSGKTFDLKQVRLYYANGGTFPSRMGKGQFASGGAHRRRAEAASVRESTLPRKRGSR